MPYTDANLETGMCLWEAVIEALLGQGGPQLHTLAELLIEEQGTPAARHTVMAWIEECEAEWEASREAGTELIPYDWEHCPAFLARKLAERFPDLVPA